MMRRDAKPELGGVERAANAEEQLCVMGCVKYTSSPTHMEGSRRRPHSKNSVPSEAASSSKACPYLRVINLADRSVYARHTQSSREEGMCFCVFWFSDCSNAACPKEGLVEEKESTAQRSAEIWLLIERERETF